MIHKKNQKFFKSNNKMLREIGLNYFFLINGKHPGLDQCRVKFSVISLLFQFALIKFKFICKYFWTEIHPCDSRKLQPHNSTTTRFASFLRNSYLACCSIPRSFCLFALKTEKLPLKIGNSGFIPSRIFFCLFA